MTREAVRGSRLGTRRRADRQSRSAPGRAAGLPSEASAARRGRPIPLGSPQLGCATRRETKRDLVQNMRRKGVQTVCTTCPLWGVRNALYEIAQKTGTELPYSRTRLSTDCLGKLFFWSLFSQSAVGQFYIS